MTIVELSAVTLAVRDMARSLAFYQGLGFTIKYGDDSSAFSSLHAGLGYLNLDRVQAGHGKSGGWGRTK